MSLSDIKVKLVFSEIFREAELATTTLTRD